MIIESLKVENIRSHTVFTSKLAKTTTVITGPNGSGKTSLIEAAAVALGGKSFKGTDSEMLRYSAPWWRIDVEMDGQERIIKFQPGNEKKRKEFIVDGKKTARLPQAQRYPFVLFEPDDLRLLHGSPSRRRHFIDRLAGQFIPEYSRVVRRYERALSQRNRLLKNGASNSDLFAWNVSLAKYGAHIIETRARLVEKLNENINATYGKIAKTDDVVSVGYTQSSVKNGEQRLLAELESHIERDRTLGYTSTGPHRHDITFMFNGASAISSASRGETRTLILALKFLEVDIIEEIDGRKPIILLDDVFSELDEKRQTQLATKFQGHQIIMTSTSSPKTLHGAKTIRLKTNK